MVVPSKQDGVQSLKFDKKLETLRRSNDTGTTFYPEWIGVDFQQSTTLSNHYYSILFKMPPVMSDTYLPIDSAFFSSPNADFSLSNLVHSKSYSTIVDEFKDRMQFPGRIRCVGTRSGYGGYNSGINIFGFLTMPFSSSSSDPSVSHVDYRFWINGSGPIPDSIGYFELTKFWMGIEEATRLPPSLYTTMSDEQLWQYLNANYVAPYAAGPPWYDSNSNLSGRLFDSVDYGSMLDQSIYVDDVSSGNFDSDVQLGSHSTIGGQLYRCLLSVGWPMQG